MYKKILVPVDGSHTATLGLREALKLAKAQGARIRLIHMLDELAVADDERAGAWLDLHAAAQPGRRAANIARSGDSVINLTC